MHWFWWFKCATIIRYAGNTPFLCSRPMDHPPPFSPWSIAPMLMTYTITAFTNIKHQILMVSGTATCHSNLQHCHVIFLPHNLSPSSSKLPHTFYSFFFFFGEIVIWFKQIKTYNKTRLGSLIIEKDEGCETHLFKLSGLQPNWVPHLNLGLFLDQTLLNIVYQIGLQNITKKQKIFVSLFL